ncbi:hypothetical protein K6U45_21275 [Vibrio vulnificus]|nr:hypothetical protein [Vibrio vulnificus]MCG6302317.1 hypothetical protein [Vibrio vulnificus]
MKRYTGFVLGLLPVWVGAVEPLALSTESGIEFIPTLHTYYRFDDNIAKQEADSSHVSTIGVKPALLARIDRNQYKADSTYVEISTKRILFMLQILAVLQMNRMTI